MTTTAPTTAGAPPAPSCPDCGASAEGCHGVRLVAGRRCCPTCSGIHPTTTEETAQ